MKPETIDALIDADATEAEFEAVAHAAVSIRLWREYTAACVGTGREGQPTDKPKPERPKVATAEKILGAVCPDSRRWALLATIAHAETRD